MNATPGPWKIAHSSAPDWTGDWYIHAPGGTLIAMSEGWSDEEQANARLIAAAPDLLEALKEIAKGEGAYSRDPLIHAGNVITNMKVIANEAIHKVEE